MTREDVLLKFWGKPEAPHAHVWVAMQRMADEIVRLQEQSLLLKAYHDDAVKVGTECCVNMRKAEAILAALREPSDGVCVAAIETLLQDHANAMVSAAETIRAAVAAAEKEVEGE